MLKIGLCGYGKMGKEIETILLSSPEQYQLLGIFNSSSEVYELDRLCNKSDLIIDFSSPIVIPHLINYAKVHQTKLVICTTGLSASDFKLLEKAATSLSILYSANTSIGANLIALLAAKAGVILGQEFDIDILDIHHRNKIDAPSGTALMMEDKIKQASKDSLINHCSMRCGGVFGQHKISFTSNDEVISLNHTALNRATFARGAIKVAEWLHDKLPGYYTMDDVLNLKI